MHKKNFAFCKKTCWWWFLYLYTLSLFLCLPQLLSGPLHLLSCCVGLFKMGAGYLSHLGHIIVFQIAEIVSRFERKGFKLVAIKIVVPSKGFAEKHYHDLKERPFFNGLCDFLSSGPVIAMVRRTITLILISTTTYE